MLKKGARIYTGGSLAPFEYKRPHTVTEIIRDRAVISYGAVVIAVVKTSDLTLA